MANNKIDYHIYSHNNPSIQTMGEFVSENDSLGIGLNIPQLLIYDDENGNSNLDNLIRLYTKEELTKYKALIDQIRNTKPSQKQTTTTVNVNNQQSSISIENPLPVEEESSDPIQLKNSTELYSQLRNNGDVRYQNHTLTDSNRIFLRELYNDDVRLLFLKFIYRVETETNYDVIITDSGRTEAEARKQLALGNGASLFSYHGIGLALDINLRSRLTDTRLMKASSNALWITSGVVKISDEMKLNWGGRFKNVNPDPIHFDAKFYYKVNRKKLTSLSPPIQPSNILDGQSISSTPTEPSSPNTPYLDLPIKIGTILALPISEVDRDVLITETNQTVNTVDYESFLAKQLVDLLSDKGYKRTFIPKQKAFTGSVQEIFPYITVWVWSRAASLTDISSAKYDHKILNITPYINNLNTNVTEAGGNFSFSLPGVAADLRDTVNTGKGWKIQQGTQKANKSNSGDYVNQSHTHYIDNDNLKRSRMYFDKVLQANDVVFIRFERLQLEDSRKNLDELETISINELPNQVFDMIGLIDTVQTNSQFSQADINISVSGRDLVKLLIEDGVYFYATDFTSDGIFANTGATNSRLGRFGSSGEYLSRFQRANKTVDRSLKFIINSLGTIEICPGTLFDGYANTPANRGATLLIDKRSRAFPLADSQTDSEIEQSRSNDDTRISIIEKIDRIQKANKIQSSSAEEVFSLIQDFLSARIKNKQLKVANQQILSWEEIDNNEVIKNRIPFDLIDTFLLSQRIWVDKRQRNISHISLLNATIAQLENLYSTCDKVKLAEVSLPLFSSLSKKISNIVQDLPSLFLSKISVSDILSELNNYVLNIDNQILLPHDDNTPLQPLFKIADINLLNSIYENELAKGNDLTVGVISKKLNNLSIEELNVFNETYRYIVNTKQLPIHKPATAPLLAGIWQIIKLVIDDSVKDRRLTDASIGNENGSLLNAFKKICQDPFCEFYTDTYGDQFYLIARKKPFDKESILSMLESRAVYEKFEVNQSLSSRDADKFGSLPPNVDSLTVTKQNLIMDIEEIDVITDSLSYSTEAYSWYKLQLDNNSSGTPADMAFAYLKAIYFEEYADIFGSKPYSLQTSYIPYLPIIDKNKELPTAYFIRQGVYDLKYMIESHAHLPFTRTGTIVLNGDRRIKRGTFIRYKGTGEIFYVDAVSHSFSIDSKTIDRTTTLQVSRGMVEAFIRGKEFGLSNKNNPRFSEDDEFAPPPGKRLANDKVNISYFNICSLPIDESIFSNADAKYSAFSKASTANWKVNKTVFNFFLKKLQFAKNDKELFDANLNLFEL